MLTCTAPEERTRANPLVDRHREPAAYRQFDRRAHRQVQITPPVYVELSAPPELTTAPPRPGYYLSVQLPIDAIVTNIASSVTFCRRERTAAISCIPSRISRISSP